ncbi:hypothetical protein J6590_052169 [Homalodisca vitripennis]|nr:hypothetical protein J6590_052169 [Homalodisca vitripennis]
MGSYSLSTKGKYQLSGTPLKFFPGYVFGLAHLEVISKSKSLRESLGAMNSAAAETAEKGNSGNDDVNDGYRYNRFTGWARGRVEDTFLKMKLLLQLPGTSRMWEDTDRGRGVVIQMWMTQNALLLVIVSDLEVIHHYTGL